MNIDDAEHGSRPAVEHGQGASVEVSAELTSRLLLPHHLAILREGSGISDDVIRERGYFSVSSVEEARKLGFSPAQCLVPALILPRFTARGERVAPLLRADQPRTFKPGRVAKYEHPRGQPPILDVPPRCVGKIADPAVTLYITEGTKKADSLATCGACVISLGGVYNWRGTNHLGGKVALPDWEDVALAGRDVCIVFDSDVTRKPEVATALKRLKGFLEGRKARVAVIYLPDAPDGRRQGVDDYFVNGGTMSGLAALARTTVITARRRTMTVPEIIISGRFLPEIVEDAWKAFLAWREAGHHPVYERAGRICRVETRVSGPARIHDFGREDLAFVMERAARFVSEQDSGPLGPARMPRDVQEDMLVAWKKPLEHLEAISGIPLFAPDGSFDTTPGYQAKTCVFYAPTAQPVPAVPECPAAADLARAIALLRDEWLADMPFVDRASSAHLLALCLTPLVRSFFSGPAPLFAIDAPTQGTGKGLLAQTAGLIVSGRTPATTTVARDTEEERKRYTALLREGADLILIDNVKQRLDSPVLAAILTSETWRDRLLGVSETVELPNRAVWLVTGNNLEFDGEIGRRSLLIRLDSKVDRPWERDGFKHPNLLGWVRDNRHDLIWALAILVRNWLVAGRPRWTVRPLGSFEGWAEVVGGVLAAAGIDGFLDNRESVYRTADAESEEWREFVAAWWESHGSALCKASELVALAREQELLPSLFAGRDASNEQGVRTRIGKSLAARRDRRIGGFFVRIPAADRHQKGKLYQLQLAEGDGDPPGSPSADPPRHNPSSADSSAEGAEVAEPVSELRARAGEDHTLAACRAHARVREVGDRPPQGPQPPPAGSECGPFTAELDAEDGLKPVLDPPQSPACTRCGQRLSVVAISDRCGRCQR